MCEQLSPYTSGRDEPLAYVYRLVANTDPDPDGPYDRSGGRCSADRPVAAPCRMSEVGPARPKAAWNGQLDVAEIAGVVGIRCRCRWSTPIPRTTPSQTLTYDRTFTVPGALCPRQDEGGSDARVTALAGGSMGVRRRSDRCRAPCGDMPSTLPSSSQV